MRKPIRGALEAGGETVGVPGCGLGHVYPKSNRSLYRDLAGRGLLITEFPPSEGPRREYFPRRNRILAGLARAVVVVQAGIRSGALITVDHANDIGVEVLAVPGPADLPASRGVNELLRDGAGVATSASDVLSLLGEATGAYTGSVRAAVRGWEPEVLTPSRGPAGASRPEDVRLLSVLTGRSGPRRHAVHGDRDSAPRHAGPAGAAGARRPGSRAAGRTIRDRIVTDGHGAPLALYVHVPFCVHRCHYCDFAVTRSAEPPVDEWLACVEQDLTQWKVELETPGPFRLDTVFVGGGTPSLLGGPGMEGWYDSWPDTASGTRRRSSGPSRQIRRR